MAVNINAKKRHLERTVVIMILNQLLQETQQQLLRVEAEQVTPLPQARLLLPPMGCLRPTITLPHI